MKESLHLFFHLQMKSRKEFGKTELIDVDQFKKSEIDPLASGAQNMMFNINAECFEALHMLCKAYSGSFQIFFVLLQLTELSSIRC